jgi:lysophospholipase L1-like esterase
MTSLLKRVVFSLVVLFGVMAAVEVTARLVWAETDLVMNPILWGFRDHPTLLWMYRPQSDITCEGCPLMRTNALGLRGPELAATPPEGTVRVLSLGESTTFGAFVAEEQTYTAQLQPLLQAQLDTTPIPGVSAVETINAGVEAWSIWQSRVWLEEVGLSLQPDVILVYHQLNDTLPVGVQDRANFLYQVRDTDRVQLMRRQRYARLFGVLLRSRAYLALRRTLLQLPTDLPTPQGQPLQGIGERAPEADRKQALSEMLSLSESADAQLVIIRPHYAAARKLLKDRVLTDFAAEHDLPLVNMPRYLQRNRRQGPPLYSDGVHPTAEGHALYAAAIAEIFASEALLPAAAP